MMQLQQAKITKPNAHVIALTHEKAKNTNNVVVGTILINNFPAYLLFDCGAIHLFISKRFTKKLRLKPSLLVEPFRVSSPTCKAIETHVLHQDGKININDRIFSTDLIQLTMLDFSDILGMD